MLLLIGGVGQVEPRYKRRNTLGNDSKNQLVENVAPFNSVQGTIPTSEPLHFHEIITIQKTLAFFHTLPLTFFLY